MALRVQLINEFMLPLVITKADPIDINNITKSIKRSKSNDGVIYEIIVDIAFIKEGRLFLKQAYELYGGIDAKVDVLIYEEDPNERIWKLYFTGQINFLTWELSEDRVIITTEQTGIQRNITNSMSRDVDLQTTESVDGVSLPANPLITVPLHSKTIRREFHSFHGYDPLVYQYSPNTDGDLTPEEVRHVYFIPSFEPTAQAEIDERTDFSSQLTRNNPIENKLFQFKLKEAGSYDFGITLHYRFTITTFQDTGFPGPPSGSSTYTVTWYLVTGKVDNYTTTIVGGTSDTAATSGGILNFNAGKVQALLSSLDVSDEVYFYADIQMTSLEGGVGLAGELTFYPNDTDFINVLSFNIIGDTKFEETTTKGSLIYEAFLRCLQFHTNEVDCFKSDLLGRTDLGYDVDGDYSMLLWTIGKYIRGRETDQQLFASLDELIEFVNSVACVGFGFEVIDGKQKFVLERKSHFYNKSFKIGSLGKLYDIKRKVDASRYHNQFEVGYKGKLDIRQVNGIDEHNTIRRWIVPVSNTKNKLTVSTDVRTSGYIIEGLRRLKYSSEDSNHDDEKIVIVVTRDGDDFKSKKDEGYTLITGSIDPPTGYNYDISPRRNAENWKEFIASGLIRSSNKILKFSYGEVNYVMTTQKTGESEPLAENGDIDLTNIEPIWDNEKYSADKIHLTTDIVKLIEANPYGYLEFEDRLGNKMEIFINEDGIDHNSTEVTGDISGLRVHRPG